MTHPLDTKYSLNFFSFLQCCAFQEGIASSSQYSRCSISQMCLISYKNSLIIIINLSIIFLNFIFLIFYFRIIIINCSTMSSQLKRAIQSFDNFITTIIDAQKLTDLIKYKLFELCQSYSSIQLPQQIWILFAKNNQIQISFSNVKSFCQSQNLYLTNKQTKTLSKYFGFHLKPFLAKSNLYDILKSKNNNFYQSKDFSQKNIKKCLICLIKKVFTDFDKIDQSRRANISSCKLIQEYFQKNYQTSRGLSIQALKQHLYETGLYSRLNFNFIKQYIFGQNNFILWSELFSAKQRQVEQIKQLQEEQIQTHKTLPVQVENDSLNKNHQSILQDSLAQSLYSKNFQDKSQMNQNLNQKVQNLKQQANESEVSTKYNNQKLQHALSEIDQIQSLLQKQKQKYQLETTQLKQTYNKEKNQSILNFLNKRPIQQRYPIQPIKSYQQKYYQSSQKDQNLKQSIIFCSQSRQSQLTICRQSRQREAGKIKRRTSSKHANHVDINSQPHLSLSYQDGNQILEQIRKQQQIYNKMIDQRNKFIKSKQTKIQLQKIKQQNYKLQLNKPEQIITRTAKTPELEISSILQRKDHFYTRQTNRSSSRSRISSQKRQQIVKKATSQAKLRIQQIQKRALSRISKYQTQNVAETKFKQVIHRSDQNVKKLARSINQSSEQKQAKTTKNSNLLNKYLLNDLLSHQPVSMNLRLGQSSAWTKYRNVI